MDIVIFSFSEKAGRLSTYLNQKLAKLYNCNVISYTSAKYAYISGISTMDKTIQHTVHEYFKTGNIIIFISACGIAVRSIAPFIKNKTTDPCVIVMDELGHYVISLLSGHIGGGNAFTQKIAAITGAVPVITTATDINNKFSIDVFAKNNGLHITDMYKAKDISADIIHNKRVGMITGRYINIDGDIPDELDIIVPGYYTFTGNLQLNSGSYDNIFIITPFTDYFKAAGIDCHNKKCNKLYLTPKQTVLGIGCKRDTDTDKLSTFVKNILMQYNISPASIAAITSIDIKKNEPALINLAKEYNCDFLTYDNSTLKNVPGDFSSSEFVTKITGVDNVCERAALCCSNNNHLFLRKIKSDGMTIAIAFLDINISMLEAGS